MRINTRIWAPIALLGLAQRGLTVEVEAGEAVEVSARASPHAPVVATIEIGEDTPKVEVHIVEVVKTVTVAQQTVTVEASSCAHTTGILLAGPGPAKVESEPTPTPIKITTIIEGPTIVAQPTPEATQLFPAVHWDVDLRRVENLQANKSVEMFYCNEKLERTDGKVAQPSNNTAVGFLKVDKMPYPAVQLDHTVFIASLTCSNSSVKVTFNNKKAFEAARSDWSAHKSDVVFITVDPKCRLATDDVERGYVLVKKFTVDNSTLSITGHSKIISFAQAVGEETPIDFSFGNFQTNSTDGFNVPVTGPKSTQPLNGTHPFPPSSNSTVGGTALKDPSGDTTFDQTLDRKIGFMTVDELEKKIVQGFNMTLEDVGATPEDIPDLLAAKGLTRRRLARRGLFSKIKKGIKGIGKAIGKAVKGITKVIKTITKPIGNLIEAGVNQLGKWLSISKSFNKELSFDTKGNTATADTPWGKGVELFKKESSNGKGSAAVYCVECGATGKVALEGKVTFSIIQGLREGHISATGNLHAGLQLGIVASYKDEWGFEKNLVSVPLSPFSIPGIITIGPSLSLDAGASLSILAEGSLLAGIVADMPNLVARLDLVDGSKSTMPALTPQVQPVFEVKGKVALSANAFLALKIAVGVKILNGVILDKSVGIVEKPKLSITAGVEASYTKGGEGVQWADPNCKGVKIDVGFSNEVLLDLFGNKKTISDWQGPKWGHCLRLAKRQAIGGVSQHAYLNGTAPIPANETVSTPEKFTEGSTFSKIITTQGAIGLHYSLNGNIYAVPDVSVENPNDPSALFTSDPTGDFIMGDSHGRYLHSYTSEIETYGVARLRLHDTNEMPKSASLLSFVSTPEKLLILADLAGAIYFPIICMYEGPIFPKLFLAKEPESGSLKLEDPAMMSVLTGSKVKDCGYVPLKNTVMPA